MKATVCQLNNAPDGLEQSWQDLVAHAQANASDLVLLPEMVFYPWLAETRQPDPADWQKAVNAHEQWLSRLAELAPAMVIGTRPVLRQGKRLNEGFVWEPATGYRAAHTKYYLPDEEGFWEASWYKRGDGDFSLIHSGNLSIGFLICTELWFNARAREYGQQGMNLLACPRATPLVTADKWVAGGRTAAVVSGAFCLSSNIGQGGGQVAWGGTGWIIEPEEGNVWGLTSWQQPFLTLEIDLKAAEKAKHTYPRYVPD